MSRLRANQITNQSADGAPTVQNGLIVSGISSVGTGVTLSSIGDDMTTDQKEKSQEVVVPVILTRIASMAAFMFRKTL